MMGAVVASMLLAGVVAAAPADEIVFSSDRDGIPQLHVLRLDGSAPRRLLTSDRDQRHPAPSRDGARIVFESRGGDGVDLVSLDRATGAVTRLTRTGHDAEPSCGPDGRIAFVSRRDGDRAVFVMDRDGTNVTRLSPPGADDRGPAWSPDGARIAFSRIEGTSEHVFVMAADGTGGRRVTSTPGESSSPCWTPDGRRIVFNHAKNDIHDVIVTIAVDDGADRRPLGAERDLRTEFMDRNTASWGPAPSPDGRRIVFTSVRTGNAEIYLMDADGRGVRRLTRSRGQDLDPAWLPPRR